MEQESPVSKYSFETMYSFESESQLFEIRVDTDCGREYRSLPTAEEKTIYLKRNGKLTTKDVGGRIMTPQPGTWVHRNIGQTEYLIHAESELGEQYVDLKDPKQQKAFMEKNVTRIREWPERIARYQQAE